VQLVRIVAEATLPADTAARAVKRASAVSLGTEERGSTAAVVHT
jgi:hypothetical protein